MMCFKSQFFMNARTRQMMMCAWQHPHKWACALWSCSQEESHHFKRHAQFLHVNNDGWCLPCPRVLLSLFMFWHKQESEEASITNDGCRLVQADDCGNALRVHRGEYTILWYSQMGKGLVQRSLLSNFGWIFFFLNQICQYYSPS